MASVVRLLFQKSYPSRNFRTVFRIRSGPTQIVPQLWRPNYRLIRDNGEEIVEIRRAFVNVRTMKRMMIGGPDVQLLAEKEMFSVVSFMDVTRYRRMYLEEKNYEGNPLIEFPKIERGHDDEDDDDGFFIEEILGEDDDDVPEEIGEEPEQVEPQLEDHPPAAELEEHQGPILLMEESDQDQERELHNHPPAAELEEQEGPIPLMEESDVEERELDNHDEVDEDLEG